MTVRRARPRRKHHRLKDHDYASGGAYYVTFCTYEKKCFLSQVEPDGTLLLGVAGLITEQEILKTEELRQDFELIEYSVMPNHVHLLFSLTGEHAHGEANAFQDQIKGSISGIIGAIKGAVTRKMRERHNTPSMELWQERFHDHVVRDQSDLDRIREYIINNPGNWAEDQYHPDTIAEAQAVGHNADDNHEPVGSIRSTHKFQNSLK